MAPAYVGAGDGVTITTGSGTVEKTGCTAGNLLIAQVYDDGLSEDFTIGTYVNMEDLAGAAGLTSVTSTPVGITATFSVFFGRATANGTCSLDLTVGASGEDLVSRIYEFEEITDATTEAEVLDNAEAAGDSGTSTTVAHATHTTHGDNRLVIELIGIDATQAVTSFTGETGGDYTLEAQYSGAEAVDYGDCDYGEGEYGVGECAPVGTIALQTAPIPTANTLSGGTFTIASADWGTWGAALVPGVPVPGDGEGAMGGTLPSILEGLPPRRGRRRRREEIMAEEEELITVLAGVE